ncbi:MAG TPA: cyclic nucleotide-binding domain-containing protein [Deltaproteobacteria bacterium]|nr:cyclic nucleotide-binding domain-containing protein [Deltaproteobacteria bacterium]HIJ35996.1 cyclic nucleotide-binding domain-containing protein [Deltaproteobacteria bacterium]
MVKTVGKWLKIYEDETSLFLWTVLLFFIIRTASILFNNFAETAFLKRFGVEYLPIVNVINSISTFFIMAFLTGIMARVSGSRMLSYLFMFCGMSVACLRLLIPLGFDLIYPLFWILKAQYEVLLALVFWNMANDLFNTRQSKRLFPLITAGGVLGGIIGSFATPSLAKLISMDNLLFAYLITTMIGAFMVKRMGMKFPSLLVSDKKDKKAKKVTKLSSLVDEFKKIGPLMKESTLVKILILLTLLPNIVIPIINYQFAFAVNETYATQGGMLSFFGYFRGCMNIISLVILLFIGRVYGRWGLPVVLMFHPMNYMLAFLAFLLKFDIVSAMYARVSTTVLRTTMNNPARAVLMGLFPVSYRAVIRPFLRGTVVRIGILIGSGIIMISEGLFTPRYLSIAAMVFVGGWIATTFFLKKSYPRILLDLISRNILDLKSLEDKDVGSVFADKKIQSELLESFLSSRGNDCLWHARLLKSQGITNFDAHILTVLKQNDDKTRIELLSMLSRETGKEAIPIFRELADPEKPQLTLALVQAADRMEPAVSNDFCRELFDASTDPEIQAYALIGLYRNAPQSHKKTIDSWLMATDPGERKSGVIAAGESREVSYISQLKGMLEKEENAPIFSHILTALHRIGMDDLNNLVQPYLTSEDLKVRLASLDAFEINSDGDIRTVIGRMDDPSEEVFLSAKAKIQTAEYQNPQILVESLNMPRRKIRDGIFELLETLNIKNLDIFRFARSQVELCYNHVAEIDALTRLPDTRERDLLVDHLENSKQIQLENILRVLATEDRSGEMRLIWRGLFSSDARRRSNSLEALDGSLNASLSKILLPLFEGIPLADLLRTGRKHFKLAAFDGDRKALYSYFLEKDDWVTVVLTLYLIEKQGMEGVDFEFLQPLLKSQNRFVNQMATRAIHAKPHGTVELEEEMEAQISIPDKILRLKSINIFEGLSVSELAAVASVTEEIDQPAGETVIKEGESGESMYLIISGEVSVIKDAGETGREEIELARIGAGDYFGEMALFEDAVRSATIRTAEESRFLILHKQEFTEIVREYPQIALHICKALSERLRSLHAKVQGLDK